MACPVPVLPLEFSYSLSRNRLGGEKGPWAEPDDKFTCSVLASHL